MLFGMFSRTLSYPQIWICNSIATALHLKFRYSNCVDAKQLESVFVTKKVKITRFRSLQMRQFRLNFWVWSRNDTKLPFRHTHAQGCCVFCQYFQKTPIFVRQADLVLHIFWANQAEIHFPFQGLTTFTLLHRSLQHQLFINLEVIICKAWNFSYQRCQIAQLETKMSRRRVEKTICSWTFKQHPVDPSVMKVNPHEYVLRCSGIEPPYERKGRRKTSWEELNCRN